jgi:alanyl-tRNA synthetase
MVLKSAPLVPEYDDTLLFINAGMAPLKPFFLNQLKPPATNLASCQKCIRAGGKHNDLDQVGYTQRHHTFFEMCGNFSFGGYAHKEAIHFAWEYLVKILKLSEERLHVTVHPQDATSYEIWSQIVPQERIYKLPENEWSMGGDGPCGMCTEIFYDHGPEIVGTIEDGDRFVEVWNIVLMTHQIAGTSKTPLPQICIDTGMGLERIAAVLAGTSDNYQSPFFREILEEMSKISKRPIDPSFRIMIDHARATVFAISDGVIPDTWGRGYVLRKIMRRALKNGSIELFKKCMNYVIDKMHHAYPEILQFRELVIEHAEQENEQVARILLGAEENIFKLIGNKKVIDSENAYILYDRYGISPDITQDIADKLDLELELGDFDKIQNANKVSRKSNLVVNAPSTNFLGYDFLECEANVLEVVKYEGTIYLVTDQTVFYAESGGQEADHGLIQGDGWSATVVDVIKSGQVYLHKISCDTLPSGACKMKVDESRRKGLMQHHSATHLLLRALRMYLGKSVIQQGSLVKSDALRFDFLYPKPVEPETLKTVERQVNLWIQENSTAKVYFKTQEEAKSCGAISMIGEKYSEIVRVVELGGSLELCCGTHVNATGDIGYFAILKESSVKANVRRIEACAGMRACSFARDNIDQIKSLAFNLKTQPEYLEKTIERMLRGDKQKEAKVSKEEGLTDDGKKWVMIFYQEAQHGLVLKDSNQLVKEGYITLSINYTSEKKTSLLLRCEGAILKLNKLITEFGGRSGGGGRSDMAQGGLPDKPKQEEMKQKFLEVIEN